jgi:crotonobetainyl-CoA:carnitine CoA-transferase CaiB-like acyl-CoA transferase
MPEMTARPQLPERTPRAKGEPTALDGLLVVDFTRVVAGPACTQTLADFGAEVIKIENPDGGDDTRHYEHAEIGGESAAFLSLNRNKRGIALDFNNPAALEVARELIAKADVVVENFSGGIMKKFGLDYASVAPTNPRLVYCSISAYGRKGEFALRPGFDPITQAESGFMSLNGFPEGEPVRTGPPIVDMATGMSACNRDPAGADRPRPARPRPAGRGRADRHRRVDDRISTAWPIWSAARIRAASEIRRTGRPP